MLVENLLESAELKPRYYPYRPHACYAPKTQKATNLGTAYQVCTFYTSKD